MAKAKAKPSELKSMLQQVQSLLNLIADTDDATFEKSWGVSRNQALKNLAKLCDDFQVSGVTDAQDDDRTFEGYKISDLRAAFDDVSNPEDWKGPIDHWICDGDLPIVSAAVRFFTSTEVVVTERVNGAFGPRLRIKADGYRAGPAGDQ